MRSARNNKNNKRFNVQSRIKQFRGRVGQHPVVRKIKFNSNAQTRFVSGVRTLTNEVNYDSAIGNTAFQRRKRQNKFFQRRGIQTSENARLVGNSQSSVSYLASAPSSYQSSFVSVPVDPVIRGRLRTNYGFMRSDTLVRKQQLRRELEKARIQQQLQLQQMQQLHRAQQQSQQQQQWLRKSLKQLKNGSAKQQNNSSRTTVYNPTTAVVVHIPNVVNSGSSDVTVVVGKPQKKQKKSFDQSHVTGWQSQSSSAGRKQRQSAVSFEESVDVEEGNYPGNHGDYPEDDILVV